MREDEFSRICRTIETDHNVYVQNIDLLYSGRVVACNADSVTVEAFGHLYDWQAEHCRSINRRVNPLGPPSAS